MNLNTVTVNRKNAAGTEETSRVQSEHLFHHLFLLPAAELINMSLDEDARWLEWVTRQFESIAGEDKEIDIDEFKTALKVKEVRKTESSKQ